jgi:hypothetical protein
MCYHDKNTLKELLNLCETSDDIDYISNNIELLNTVEYWIKLCKNPAAIDLIKENQEKLTNKYWCDFYGEKGIHKLLNFDCVSYGYLPFECNFIYSLCQNPNAIEFIEKVLQNVSTNVYEPYIRKKHNYIYGYRDDEHFSKAGNLSPETWRELCLNPNAIHLIDKYLDKIIYEVKTISWDTHGRDEDFDAWTFINRNPNAHLLQRRR